MLAQDASAFESALVEAYRVGLSRELHDVLTEAIVMDFHTRHEDIAHALQKIKHPASVDALFSAATRAHEYLEYDELFGLARKCTWALADIGTDAARARLRELAQDPNPIIAGYALKRLNHWDEESSRKG